MRRLGIVVPLALLATALAAPAHATPPKHPVARGYGGAVTSVDPDASAIGLKVLKQGGNAVDAAVATAAALGVTEPFSSGIGGGGYFVYYDAKTRRVHTIDGRETAPAAMPHDAFIDPKTGKPYGFSPARVTSGVSVGVPGTLATWQRALKQWGTRSLARSLEPAEVLARRGFRVDQTFHDQVAQNARRFKAFTSTRKLYGRAPEVGTTFRNPDLARTYDLIADRGAKALYDGPLTSEIVHTVRKPPTTKDTTLPIPKGFMRRGDITAYRPIDRAPTHVDYRGLDVYGMAPSSSGGSTVGEALNILDDYPLSSMTRARRMHLYLEASALAFADRSAYVGDPAQVDVPLKDLLSQKYADERACSIDVGHAFTTPVEAGDVSSYDGRCDGGRESTTSKPATDTENVETTNLTVADKWGNVVEYTLTIEQTGGSGIVVPGRGFLLNNELTDFSAVYDEADPNRIEPRKRPRSSIAPTLVTHRNGKPFLAVGSPGGSTIITTVLQILVNRLDLGMALPSAIAAPRATQRNEPADLAEPAFLKRYGKQLRAFGHKIEKYQDIFTGTTEIGAATGIEFGPHGLLTVAAEPKRRGGGSATVVRRYR